MTSASRVRLEPGHTNPVALVEHEGRWLALHSRRDPVAEGLRLLDGVDNDAPMVVLIGVGLGYALDALEQRRFAGRVLAVEVEPALTQLMRERRDWTAWDARLTVVDVDSIRGDFWRTFAGVAEQPPTVVHPVLARTHADLVQRARAAVARAWFDHAANETARRENAGRYLLNTLRNLPALEREGDVASLEGVAVGVTAIVVGAGPSLDRNLAGIKECRDRALVIAVDTAARPLLAAGVTPDVIVAVDPTETNARHLCELRDGARTWLVAEASVDPAAVAEFVGRTFFCRISDHHPWPWLRARGLDRGPLRAWGSVLTTAFDLALRMRCERVVFAGADLAFTHGRPYARGTTFEEDWWRDAAWGTPIAATWASALARWPHVEETDVHGAPARTAPHLRAFRDWIQREALASGVRVVNASENGILRGPGIEQGRLPDLVAATNAMADSVRQRLRDAYAQRDASRPSEVPPPTAEWRSFAPNVTDGDIEEALTAREVSREEVGGPRGLEPVHRRDTASGAAGDAVAALCADDRRTIDTVTAGLSPERYCFVVSSDPGTELLPRLRHAAQALPPDGVLFAIDSHGTAACAQLRRAVEALLLEWPSASLEYRRYAEMASRLAIVRLAGANVPPAPAAADLAKQGPSDEETANRLIPLIVSYLAPASLLDLGCGSGQWMTAARRAGVAHVEGVAAGDIERFSTPHQAAFDVCLCIEVAQGLGAEMQDALVSAATRASNVVVFSSMPPGMPDRSPHARPLVYWAEKFWRHGYVLDDGLRQQVEQRFGAARAMADLLVVFRRTLAEGDANVESGPLASIRQTSLAHVGRIYDLFMQSAWWQAELAILHEQRSIAQRLVVATRQLEIPAHRLEASDSGLRCFRFRTDAARRWITHQGADVRVFEGEHPLERFGSAPALARSLDGGFAVWRDEITIASTDSTDPRQNGRCYRVRVPEDVAAAEERAAIRQ